MRIYHVAHERAILLSPQVPHIVLRDHGTTDKGSSVRASLYKESYKVLATLTNAHILFSASSPTSTSAAKHHPRNTKR